MYASLEEHEVVSDYEALLRRGSVTRRLASSQHPQWCRAIGERAHADGLRVRTWSRDEMPASVWAVLADWSLTRDERWRLQQRLSWLRED